MFRKKYALLSLLLLTIFVGSSAIARNENPEMGDDFLKGIFEFRAHHKKNVIDITHLVKDYIHIGDSLDKVKSFLKKEGFKIDFDGEDRKTKETYLQASKTKEKHPVIAYDNYVIFVRYEHNTVTSIKAKIYPISL